MGIEHSRRRSKNPPKRLLFHGKRTTKLGRSRQGMRLVAPEVDSTVTVRFVDPEALKQHGI